MSSNFEENRSFLEDLARAKTAQERKRLIQNASNTQIKAIIELFLNIENLDLSSSEKRLLLKFQSYIKTVVKKKWKNLLQCRKFLKKHHTIVHRIVSCILLHLIQFGVSFVLAMSD